MPHEERADSPGDVDRRSGVLQAHRYVSRLIHLGQFKPGEKLPSALELSHQIGLSRPTVLAALKQLENEGAISITLGRMGMRVLPQSVPDQRRRIEWIDSHRETVVQMALLREMIEPRLARLVAERGVPKGTARRLRDNLRTSPDQVNSSERNALDHQFHKAIAEASGYPVLTDLALDARAWVAPTFAVIPWEPTRTQSSHHEHADILDAIIERDAERVERAVARHLDASTSQIIELLGDPKRWRARKTDLLARLDEATISA